MRISDWSSDVCSSDLPALKCLPGKHLAEGQHDLADVAGGFHQGVRPGGLGQREAGRHHRGDAAGLEQGPDLLLRSEEHTSELQSLMRISYAVFCLKKKKSMNNITVNNSQTKRTTH